MKKLALGCGLLVLLCGIGFVGVGYWGYMKVKSTVTQLAELGHIPEVEREVRVKTPYVAPVGGELTQSQVDRFMKIQTRVHDRLGQNFDRLKQNYQGLANKKDASISDLPALLGAYRDMAAAWMDAKHTQVDALNDAGLSLDEYRWIKNEVYRAIGTPFVDIDFARIAEQAHNGVDGSKVALPGGTFTGTAPVANQKLVEPYKKQLQDNMPLAAFGL